VNDAQVKIQMNAHPNTNGRDVKASVETPLFGFSKMAMPEFLRGMAEQGAVRMKGNCEKVKVASGEMADVFRETYSTSAKGIADYGAKVIEISSVTATSAFDFLTDIMDMKSPSEIMQLSVAQSHKNFDLAATHNKELWELAQRVARDTTEPVKRSVSKILQRTI